MAAEEFDFIGLSEDLRFVIGENLTVRIKVINEDKSAANVTGRTYSILIGPEGDAAVASFTPNVSDAANGIIDMTLDTSSMDAGHYKWIAWEDDRHLWSGDVEAINPVVTA